MRARPHGAPPRSPRRPALQAFEETPRAALGRIEDAGALEHDEEPWPRRLLFAELLQLELPRPGEERAEEELVVEDDDDEHDEHGIEDRAEVAFLDRDRDV